MILYWIGDGWEVRWTEVRFEDRVSEKEKQQEIGQEGWNAKMVNKQIVAE